MWGKFLLTFHVTQSEIYSMIRFVYPNINASEHFVGCGRYMTVFPGDPALSKAYNIAEPNVGHLSKVTTAVSLLAKESFDSEREVYECKDQPGTPYLGDSMGLAYLLALIHRSRLSCWEERGKSFDLWCTGTIDVVGGMPILHNVYRNLFAVKLQAFLDEKDAPLFIVPVANIEPKQRQFCRQQHINILSLEQYTQASEQQLDENRTILQLHGNELRSLIRIIFIAPAGMNQAPPQQNTTGENTDDPVQLETGLIELQSRLLRLSRMEASDDTLILEFDTLTMQLLDLLEAFPTHVGRFHEIISAYQHFAEELFACLNEQEYYRVLSLGLKKLEQRIDDLTGGFRAGEHFLGPESDDTSADSPYAFYTFDFDKFEMGDGLKKLISNDELQESEALDWLLDSGFIEAEKRLQKISSPEQLREVLQVFWRRFPRIFLYYPNSFWGLLRYMPQLDPLKWTLRFYALKKLLTRSLTAEHASEIFDKFIPADRQILSAFLVLHPKKACRSLALDILPSDERWDLLLCPKLPWLIAKELIEKSCEDSSAAYIKALFLLLRPRLIGVSSPLSIGEAYHILNIFYHIPLFLEESFFQALIALHKEIDSKAQFFPVTKEIEGEMKQRFRAFCAKGRLKDVDITEMRHIPLPIQRKLAHDGYLPRFFICNIRDVIALETVRHVEHRQDIIKFLRLRRINARALEKLARNKLLMREHQNRSAFCYNPKANSALLRTYLSTLTRREIKDISRNRNVSAYARELAGKYLSRYA